MALSQFDSMITGLINDIGNTHDGFSGGLLNGADVGLAGVVVVLDCFLQASGHSTAVPQFARWAGWIGGLMGAGEGACDRVGLAD